MNFLFAWRYFKSKKTTNAINIIAWISVVAIGVVTASLIVVFSVFNGFEDLVKGLYADFYADVRISAAKGKTIEILPQQVAAIQAINNVAFISKVVEEKALMMNGDLQTIAVVKGIDEVNSKINDIKGHIVRGTFQTGTTASPRLIIGVGIENALRVNLESGVEPVVLNMPNRKAVQVTTQEGFNAFNVYPSGAFMVQQDFDDKYVFTNIGFLKYMLDLAPNNYTALEIKLTNNSITEKTVQKLQLLLGSHYKVESRYQQNQSLFSAMQVEKWVIYGITCLILAVAAFNVIGSLTMLVLEKQKDIAILQAIGANDAMIKNIFLTEGVLLSLIGGAGGIIISTIICLLQLQFHLVKLTGGSFLIDYYPVKLLWTDYLIVVVTVMSIAIVAAYIPSRKASLQHSSLKS